MVATPLFTGVKKRLTIKQSPPPAFLPLGPIGNGVWAHALAAEQCAADGLIALQQDARRTHVHYTQVRTKNSDDVQPSQLTRQEFWEHLERCYRVAYPDATSKTGSILKFGLVVKELHKESTHEHDRDEHHHAATYSSEKHFWKKVKTVSEKFGIRLNAVAHDCYSTMFRYLRQATGKKALHELDATPYFSPQHPKGEPLKELLAIGEKYREARALKEKPTAEAPSIRSQFGILYKWVVDNKLEGSKGAVRLQADAVKELEAGRPRLIEFVKKHKSNLEDQLEFCWDLHNATQRLDRLEKCRLELLLEAATDPKAVCANKRCQCRGTYEEILAYQSVDSVSFRHLIFDALKHGRRKGSAVMVVGGKDTGKTTIVQPAALIFRTMDTPQSDSFCPLQDIRGHELFLWQDFRYNPGHPRKEEQGLRVDEGTWNRFLEGLPTRIGVAKTDGARGDFVYSEDAAFIFTGPYKMVAYRNGFPDDKETEQLDARVNYVHFNRPSRQGLDRTFTHCAMCWSRWILEGEHQWEHMHNVPADDFMKKVLAGIAGTQSVGCTAFSANSLVAPSSCSMAGPVVTPSSASSHTDSLTTSQKDFFNQLQTLVEWRAKGFLSEKEFSAAKQKMGL
jgi:hypothetical protein